MPRIPIPKRSLRSILILLTLLLGPYIVVRHFTKGGDDESERTGRDRARIQLRRDREQERRIAVGVGSGSGSGSGVGAGSGRGRMGAIEFQFDADEDEDERGLELPFGLGRIFGNNDDDNDDDEDGDQRRDSYDRADKDDDDDDDQPDMNMESSPQHTYLSNGLLIPNPSAPHPIYSLISQAKEAWSKKKARSSKTLAEAVDEYRRRYERKPPKGFDRFWKYAEENGVELPDEYDQIHHDLEPFYAIPPAQFHELLRHTSTQSGMYTISCPGITHTRYAKVRPGSNKAKMRRPSSKCTFKIVETGLNEEGKRVASERAKEQLGLLQDVEDLLEEVEVVFYSHDVPWQFVGHEYKGALEDAAAVGEFFNKDEYDPDMAHLGWASACAPHKPLRETYDPDTLPVLDDLWAADKSFIWDHKAAMDPCIHPTLTHLVGFLSGHGKGPGPSTEIYPVLAMCKTTLHADVLAVSMEAWTEDVGNDPAWEDKIDDRMLWRGKTTGIYFKDGVPWNISQRINLVSRAAQTTGHIPMLDITSPSDPVGMAKDTPLAQLNADLMDVAFVDQAIQCDKKVCAIVEQNYKFGGRKNWKEGNNYKYLLDIDGNGWSARFKRLMSTNSVVLKSTIFPEWYTDRIQPWVHYIPIKADLTDLYDALSFFRGHDAMAKEIAMAGKEWSRKYWRKEDMIAYQFRLFLEYARLMATDREKASFHLRGDDLR
ncbi:hypothetical protein IAR55_001089 [Kwoniella newhampshirensis]|uniref:Glycosyl transferase CAP10 domain-containing protein n=1 Tax=Kwoniella newhampshirensis TaxID=1651941 RepID=A0AAW0Z4S7_9TREE